MDLEKAYFYLGSTAGLISTLITIYDRFRKGPKVVLENCDTSAVVYRPGTSSNLTGPKTRVEFGVSAHVRNEGDATSPSASRLEILDPDKDKTQTLTAFPTSGRLIGPAVPLTTNGNEIYHFRFAADFDSDWERRQYKFTLCCVGQKPISRLIELKFTDGS